MKGAGAGLVVLGGGALALLLLATRRATAAPGPAPADGDRDGDAGAWSWPAVFRAVALQEGGGSWGALNPDDRGAGASWGAVQFNQRAGSLGAVLAEWRAQDPGGFDAYWRAVGVEGAPLVAQLTSADQGTRLGVRLGAAPYAAALRSAGALPVVQAAQVAVAWRLYLAPYVAPLESIFAPLDSIGAGIFFDRSIQQGPGLAAAVLTAQAGKAQADAWLGFCEGMIARAAAQDRAYIRDRLQRVIRALRDLEGAT
jgi:hypothetical protein